jgi:hypothetical protein
VNPTLTSSIPSASRSWPRCSRSWPEWPPGAGGHRVSPPGVGRCSCRASCARPATLPAGQRVARGPPRAHGPAAHRNGSPSGRCPSWPSSWLPGLWPISLFLTLSGWSRLQPGHLEAAVGGAAMERPPSPDAPRNRDRTPGGRRRSRSPFHWPISRCPRCSRSACSRRSFGSG